MITPRLEMILRHVHGKSAADIGTDHAYIPIELAERGMHVIATDIHNGPLKAAAANVKKYGKDIELRLGGGLEPLKKGETENIIIAGMGGEMIINILSRDIDKAHSSVLILQPMNYQERLRRFLFENSFIVTEEDLASEGNKLYSLMYVKNGITSKYNEIDLYLPPLLYSHPLFEKLLVKKKNEFTKIYNGLKVSAANDKDKITYIQNLLYETEEKERNVIR